MINEISNKVSSPDYTRKADNKRNYPEAPATAEPVHRSDLRHDTIEISGKRPVEMSVEQVIVPVNAQNNDVYLFSDVHHAETIRGNEETNITSTGNDNKTVADETTDVKKGVPAADEITQQDSLSSAYGTKETGVGRVIRMTA